MRLSSDTWYGPTRDAEETVTRRTRLLR